MAFPVLPTGGMVFILATCCQHWDRLHFSPGAAARREVTHPGLVWALALGPGTNWGLSGGKFLKLSGAPGTSLRVWGSLAPPPDWGQIETF